MKGKRERQRYTELNAEFQRIDRRDKKAFLSITMNKINGGDGITAELFQILKKKKKGTTTTKKNPTVKLLPKHLENSAVGTGLEKVSFHSSPKEGQCERMFKLPHKSLISSCMANIIDGGA